jgi:hypothetical protein
MLKTFRVICSVFIVISVFIFVHTSCTYAPRMKLASDASDDTFLTMVQRATFKFFYDGGHPVSGLVRDRYPFSNFCAIGGTGMGLIAMVVGAERGFESREYIAERILTILLFLQDKCHRETYHGAWPHWVNGATGANYDSNEYSDIVETSYVAQGLLTVYQYFTGNNITEAAIREISKKLWEDIEWDWYLRNDDGSVDLYRMQWSWSPSKGWSYYFSGFDETMITYLLAIASPTHPIPAECYREGWVGDIASFYDGSEYYGYKQYVTRFRYIGNLGMPQFWLHYSFMTFDPRGKSDGVINQEDNVDYYDVCRNIVLIDRAYCATDNPEGYKGYGWNVWGFTASDDPWGYWAHKPGQAEGNDDNGTITPSAAIGSIIYTPKQSIDFMKYVYSNYGDSVFGEYGFKDAFTFDKVSSDPFWVANSYLAIDQGPIIINIENYRSKLIWKLFMSHTDIKDLVNILKDHGWTIKDNKY